ncbi:MAG: hypothetical protein JWM25_339 [Thermoleophilia bacterium]|nr:hypothetical protein [Thermoleophilia bacterium]MCZ4495756.1 hypothetical protein [Thermoleophilia bacterium]
MLTAYDTWWSVVVAALLVVIAWALLWSVPAVALRRNDLADVAWGLTFPMLALVTGGLIVGFDVVDHTRATVALGISIAWGVRLAVHIGDRWRSHAEEDRRYAAMRAGWGSGVAAAFRSITRVFLLQSLLVVIVAQPLLLAATVHVGRSTLGWLDYVGIVIALAGLLLEVTADRQLRQFLARKRAGDEAGYLMRGVWSWSRHPNYAGDAILWIGLGVLGIAAALDADARWLIIPAAIGPVVMFVLLRYVSGVPLAERGRAGADWDAYVERTSSFFPWRTPR